MGHTMVRQRNSIGFSFFTSKKCFYIYDKNFNKISNDNLSNTTDDATENLDEIKISASSCSILLFFSFHYLFY